MCVYIAVVYKKAQKLLSSKSYTRCIVSSITEGVLITSPELLDYLIVLSVQRG